ncbi:MAG TPA: putative sporulation protein YtxC [Desulfotomaculum sp.]|nr:putative sporulation protein YtxC [Desulfotomaculum sp.]
MRILQCISIGASTHIELVRGRLASDLKKLEGCGMKLRIEENPAGKYTFLSCSVSGDNGFQESDEEALSLFKAYIADVLADLIILKWQKAFLLDIIRENYYYFGEAERSTIFDNALRYLEDFTGQGMLGMRKKRRILARIRDFLNSGNLIVVDGFIRFRMKDYIRELQEAADKAVDDFLMDKEYQEFIQLLKYFVDIQDSRTDLINVVMKPNGSFMLYDGQNRAVNSTYLEGFIVDLIESEINYEDLLISALITIAPREIVFHSGKSEGPQSTLETIKSIFSNRVTLCRGCDLCTVQN